MNLATRTREALDWDVLLDALSSFARTAAGARAALKVRAFDTLWGVLNSFDAVDEVERLSHGHWPLPVGGVADCSESVGRARRGRVLDVPELRAVGLSLEALSQLEEGLTLRADDVPVLAGIAANIVLDFDLVLALGRAFDNTGELSGDTYPELAQLRKRIRELHASVRHTLEELIKGDTFAGILQESYVTMRSERYVLPIKEHAKRWDIGVVHDVSGSGATVFMEPHQVIALNNERRVAEGLLAAAEKRILAELSSWVGRHGSAIDEALQAAVQIDLAVARNGLASLLSATRPAVQMEGIVSLKAARHPVLALRGVKVVANDLAVGGDTPALVLTGPNTGGKTVALKTVGLCVALVRIGCFIPANDDSRVDFFQGVLADIGDAQTVHGDLSSFSGHLVALEEMRLAAAPGWLLLLDELCTGTDPAQGAALARAVIEALMDAGATLVVTTHFAQLKALALGHKGVAMAAVEYVEGKPTYRVVADATGESHAFDTAVRVGLAGNIVDRGRALMGNADQALSDALNALDHQRVAVEERARTLADKAQDLASREATIVEQEARIAVRSKKLEKAGAAKYLERIKQAEKAISAVVADLQRHPSHGAVDGAKASVSALKGLIPGSPLEASSTKKNELAVGDRVRLVKFGSKGTVVGVGGAIEVRVGNLVVRAKPHEVEKM